MANSQRTRSNSTQRPKRDASSQTRNENVRRARPEGERGADSRVKRAKNADPNDGRRTRSASGADSGRTKRVAKSTTRNNAAKRPHASDEERTRRSENRRTRSDSTRATASRRGGNSSRDVAQKKPSQRDAQGRRRKSTAKRSPAQRASARRVGAYRHFGVMSAGIILACGAVIGLLFFARPTMSKVENRNLTAFPALSWDSFWSGAFFSDMALWYSDTYPVREQLVAADQTLNGLHGIKSETQMVGGVKQADELPPAQDKKADGQGDSKADSSDDSDATSTKKTEKKEREKVEVPAQEEMAAAIQDQITNGLYVKGDTAYNIYYFSQEAVQDYADAINAAAEALDGKAQVYSVIAPNASGIMLSEKEVKDLGGTNQVDAINYFYSLYNDNVRTVDTVSHLQDHTDEYIFFRTDHHWTSLGAYYGYEAFCDAKGIKPEKREDMQHKNFGDFLGSFYGELNSAAMEANPDYVEAWVPNGTNDMILYDTDGSAETYNVINDTSNWDILGKTMAFIMGDQPLEKIENPKVTDGSSCLVIKDPFGDFFVPWLVDHYQTVWVADFRYFEGNIVDFVEEHDVKDLIIESNVTLAGGGVFGPAIMGRL